MSNGPGLILTLTALLIAAQAIHTPEKYTSWGAELTGNPTGTIPAYAGGSTPPSSNSAVDSSVNPASSPLDSSAAAYVGQTCPTGQCAWWEGEPLKLYRPVASIQGMLEYMQ
ncbi:hypothetical protein [Pseudomonas sp. MYb185]|uniref:hypothetical protein n=1 Tax=Pseudomonas sp. MYb185 TaxID=1848729 RepID=UPI0011B0A084|nr:hypothetical protein [Pseudomonas sp. MYb185]